MLKNNTRIFIIIGLVAIAVVSVLMGIHYLEAGSAEKKVTQKETPEQEYREAINIAKAISITKKIIRKTSYYRLASLDAGREIPVNDIKVKRFKYLLRSLEQNCSESRKEIANQVIALQERIINKYGKEIKLQAILEGVNRSLTKTNSAAGSKAKFYKMAVRFAVGRAR